MLHVKNGTKGGETGWDAKNRPHIEIFLLDGFCSEFLYGKKADRTAEEAGAV
jgi:hypothetical protein